MLKAESISKTYPKGQVKALQNVNLEVEPGEILGLIGPNGAGKTTFVKVGVGVLERDHGKLEVFGLDPNTSLKKISKNVGWIPQDGTRKLSTFLTGRQCVMLYNLYRNLPKSYVMDRIDYLLERFVPNREFADKKVSIMSGGQRQLMNVLIGLVPETKLLFCDEISVSLDATVVSNIYNYLRENVSEGKSVLLTSQNLEEIEILSNRVAILHKGEIVEVGKPRELSKKLLEYETIDLKFDDALDKIEGIDSMIEEIRKLCDSVERNTVSNVIRLRIDVAYDLVPSIIDILKAKGMSPSLEVGKSNLVDAIKRLEDV